MIHLLKRLAFGWIAIGAAISAAADRADAEVGDGRMELIRLQVLLARAHASPGPIDGLMGKNTELAIRAYQQMHKLDETGDRSEALMTRLREAHGQAPVMIDYEITPADVEGPFLESVPNKLVEMSKLDRLSYTSPEELLAEKFQMQRELFRELNSGKDLSQAGSVIRVANVAVAELPAKVARITVMKSREAVWAYDQSGQFIASYPATIGSSATPSPRGTHKVRGVAFDPTYTYDPEKLDFKGVDADGVFKIAPGPNNPVGNVWIDLDEPGYGIHGSPDPEEIRRQASHGCVRLTNWDAQHLGKATSPGVEVRFE